MGRHGPDRDESRRRHPLGHLHHRLGQPRPRRHRAQARHPRGRGQQGDWRQADRGRQGRRLRHHPHHDGGRLVRAGDSRGRDPGPLRRLRAAARALRFLGRRRRRQRDGRRHHARMRASPVGKPRGPGPVGPRRLVARPLHRPLCGLDLVRRYLRARPRREVRDADQLRQPRLPLGYELPPDHRDGRDARPRLRRHRGGGGSDARSSSGRTRRATTPSTTSASPASSC